MSGSRSATLTLANTGIGLLTVASVSFAPPDPRFSAQDVWPLVVPQDGQESLTVTYVGDATAEIAVTTLLLTDDDDDTTLSPLRRSSPRPPPAMPACGIAIRPPTARPAERRGLLP